MLLDTDINAEVLFVAKKKEREFSNSYNTHYGTSMNAEEMNTWAKNATKNFKKHLRKNKDSFYILCYRGMSGISAATHLTTALTLKGVRHALLYVRKENENSHGSEVERFGMQKYNSDNDVPVYVFVDDFIDSGSTMREVFKQVQNYFNVRVDCTTALTALNTHEDGILGHVRNHGTSPIEDHFEEVVQPRLIKDAKINVEIRNMAPEQVLEYLRVRE